MNPTIKFGLVPLNPTVGDVRANTDLHISAARRMTRRGCQVGVFPKMSLFGYPTGNITLWREVVKDCWKGLERFTEAVKNLEPVFIVGLPVASSRLTYCCAAVVHQGKVLGLVPQMNISAFDQPYFQSYWRRNDSRTDMELRVFQTAFGRMGVIVGEDADTDSRWKILGDVDFAVVPQATYYDSSRSKARQQNLLARSKGSYPIAAVSLYGANDGLIFEGGCSVANNGRLVAERGLFDRGQPLIVALGPSEDGPIVRKITPARSTIISEMIERRVLGLLDYLRKSGLKGFVVAESGGRDSMLATLLAVEALNRYFGHLKPKARRRAVRKAIIGVGMPTANNTAVTKALARKFCRELGVPYIEVPIGNAHHNHLHLLQKMLGNKRATAISRQNDQARLRSTLIEDLANCLDLLMLNTCDGAEDLIGYAAKFGDGAGDLGAVEDLGKGQVEEMLRWFFRRSGGKLTAVERCLTETRPSPELEKGQRAEKDNPPYPIIDMFRVWFVTEHLTPSQIYQRACGHWTDQRLKKMDPRYKSKHTLKEWIDWVVNKFTANVHKLSVAPLGAAVDPTVTFDRRFFPFPISQRNVFAADLAYMWSLPE